MKIGDIGEFGLLEELGIFKRSFDDGVTGPGDDCALIPLADSTIAISTDLLVEDVHFRRSTASAFDIGYKALAVNLSDLASTGASPVGFVQAATLPANLEVGWVNELMRGLDKCAEEFGCPLLGGDTSKAEKVSLSVTIFGKCDGWEPVMRSGAKPGDVVMLTGCTGESGGGLVILEQGVIANRDTTIGHLLSRHLRPIPRVSFGMELARRGLATSMIDVSDGVVADANHIAERSEVAIELDSARIPISEELKAACGELELDPLKLALTGGEDYELLFTVAPEVAEQVLALGEIVGLPVTVIGEVKNGSGVEVTGAGMEYGEDSKGYDHFKG